MGQRPRFAAPGASARVQRSIVSGLALLSLLGLVLLASPRSADAVEAPAFLTQFGENCGDVSKILNGECGAVGETAMPRGIATDPATGHVFVADQLNHRVVEFTPWGGWVKAFGWDVAPGAVDEQQEIRIKASAGQFKLSFEASTTPSLPFDASAGEVEAALNALTSISSKGTVSVKEVIGSPDGTTPFIHVVSFDGGSLKASDVAQIGIEDGTTPLSGGKPATAKEARTRANGTNAGSGLESCTEDSGCKAGVQGSGVGQLIPQAVAVDSGGNVYVVDRKNLRVQKFDPTGEFVWMVGGKVDEGPNHPGNLCTAAYIVEGDSCGAGSEGTGPGEFSNWPVSSYIAVGPGDVVYVGDKERIQKFEPDGTPLPEIPLPAPFDKGTVSSLAVVPSGASAGRIFVAVESPAETPPKEPDVLQLSAAGAKLCTIAVGRPTALASDKEGNAYVFADKVVPSETEADISEIRRYDSSCNQVASFADHEFEGTTGIGTNGVGDVYASNRSASGVNSYIRAYGPAPIDYESPPAIAPEIVAQYAIAAGGASASLGAEIDPKFWTDATYYLEYGSEDCAKAACQQMPLSPVPLTSAAISAPVATEAIELGGLAPNTTYHYRFVAQSSGGGPVFGKDRTFRTYLGAEAVGASPSPDARVAELSSPAAKDGGEVGLPKGAGAGGGSLFSVEPQQASATGDAVTYHSFTAFLGPDSAPATSQYLARPASPGTWSTENINPRFEEGGLRDPIVGFSEDLRHAAVIAFEPPLTADASEGFPNLYVRYNDTGALRAVTTKDHTPEISVAKSTYCLFYGGASSDFDNVFFGAKGALIEDDPKANGFNLYEWSAAQGLRLASVLPNGKAATPSNSSSFGGAGHLLSECDPSRTTMRHAISADGSKFFWTYQGSFLGAVNPLFARVDGIEGKETIQLDAAQGGPGKGGGGYQDASVDGSRVFFTDANQLTAQDTTAGSSDLYLYDFANEAGQRLSNLTPKEGEKADVAGVVGVSADGTHAYFVAKGVLDPEPNSEGEVAKSGANNLYVWQQNDGIRFLATLVNSDSDAWSDHPELQRARVSPDGRHLAFLSGQSLSGFDNRLLDGQGKSSGKAATEVFLYDYGADELSCVSCAPSLARPHGSASLPAWSTPYQQPRYLADAGDRVFFETLDALDPHDTNGERDVYEFERSGSGSCSPASPAYTAATESCLYLISSGKSSEESYLLDASASGDHAFFSTRQSLVFTDLDQRYDVYDARVGGFLPPPVPVPCESEGCRDRSTDPPIPLEPTTLDFQGPGDPPSTRKAQRCPKGKAKHRAKSRCVKSKPRHKQRRRAGR